MNFPPLHNTGAATLKEGNSWESKLGRPLRTPGRRGGRALRQNRMVLVNTTIFGAWEGRGFFWGSAVVVVVVLDSKENNFKNYKNLRKT